MVESVYCDFTKLPNDAGFQTWIAFKDVKSSSVYFYVQRDTDYYQNGTIPYDVEKLNVGGAMNLQTGIFTTPKQGKYFFSVSGKARIPASSTWIITFRINLYKNSEYVGFFG
ncbi:hypothetical protein DAPPUDRAFT_252692 [Daphnia pulex]|uniref:C1q domain-containing protein n=1 Tax=Daphnia pulex TaxID=6669 RepID=E9H3A1_DAPPU|nr:hypothetical protein DAPPUDRAFT_252692 [Daphnia pulex]|eukprot:EFX73812.1 hypothetical protein DAPPUDRAFT_252692 [Daphnia pulex]